MSSLRQKAREAGEKYYFTGKPCPKGHVSKRSVAKGVCYECQIQSGSNWKTSNREKCIEYQKFWYLNRNDKAKANTRARAKARYDRVKGTEKHLSISLAATRRRQCRKIRATPPWVDHSEINKIYLNRPKGYEVDHIVPLRGKTVCGLHVPWNLRYLPKTENCRRPRHWDNIQATEDLNG